MGRVQKEQEAEEQKSAMDVCRKTMRKTKKSNIAEQR
jgi:hypothetical protein